MDYAKAVDCVSFLSKKRARTKYLRHQGPDSERDSILP
jgi:hypothetical protein